MDEAQIAELLSSIEPVEDEIPKPPFMAAIPALPVLATGASIDLVDAWVKARGGWTHRTPAHLVKPGEERAPLFFIVPRGELQAKPGGGAPFVPTPQGGGAPRPYVPTPDPGGGPGVAVKGVPGAAPELVPGAADVPGGAVARDSDVPAAGVADLADAPDIASTLGVGTAPSVGAPDLTPATALAAADLMAFVSTADLAAARAFYSRRLGLNVLGQSPVDVTFDAGGTKLRVVTIDDDLMVAPYTVLGWTVPDIRSMVVELAARGVEFESYDGLEQDKFGVWSAPGGSLVAWFKDPDGNVLSLTQI